MQIQVLMPPLPYFSAAAVATGPRYACYIIRSVPERFPNHRGQITSHLATPFCLLSTLLTVAQAAEIPSHRHALAPTHTERICFSVPAHQAQNTLAKPDVNH